VSYRAHARIAPTGLKRPISITSESFDVVVEAPTRDVWLRGVDVCLSTAALLAASPLLLAIAVAIKLDSHGPVLYRQVRIGLDQRSLRPMAVGRRAVDRGQESLGQRSDARERRQSVLPRGRRVQNTGGSPFLIYKFRTMQVDAERGTGPVWATDGDLRVTRVGRWLRRFRLDELPQFWNVLTGDMAIVGPRPERPSFVADLRRELAAYTLRQQVRPGITGLAQVNRGPDQSMDDVRVKLAYDLEYLGRRSLRLNIFIMMRTIPVLLRLTRKRARPEA
jgi:lipopolysaccharide/colanic/teichoic acid biosynthesis glycosyltransferase